MAKEVTPNLTPLQEQLLQRADSIFEKISDTVAKATDFAAEQLPDIAYQFIAYNRAYLTGTFVLKVMFLILGLWMLVNIAIRNTLKLADSHYGGDWHSGRIGAFIVGGIFTFVSFITIISNLNQLAMVWFAPKIFLITEIIHLVKQ